MSYDVIILEMGKLGWNTSWEVNELEDAFNVLSFLNVHEVCMIKIRRGRKVWNILRRDARNFKYVPVGSCRVYTKEWSSVAHKWGDIYLISWPYLLYIDLSYKCTVQLETKFVGRGGVGKRVPLCFKKQKRRTRYFKIRQSKSLF